MLIKVPGMSWKTTFSVLYASCYAVCLCLCACECVWDECSLIFVYFSCWWVIIKVADDGCVSVCVLYVDLYSVLVISANSSFGVVHLTVTRWERVFVVRHCVICPWSFDAESCCWVLLCCENLNFTSEIWDVSVKCYYHWIQLTDCKL